VERHGHLHKVNFVRFLEFNVQHQNPTNESTGHCARYVAGAMRQAGMNVPQIPAAYKYREFLKDAGFALIPQHGYNPQIGDIVVWLPFKGRPTTKNSTGAHIYGHIQAYTGNRDYPWVSDFRQKSIHPYNLDPREVCEIYRLPENSAA
jgi:hypothetical protein